MAIRLMTATATDGTGRNRRRARVSDMPARLRKSGHDAAPDRARPPDRRDGLAPVTRDDMAEVILCETRDEMVQIGDRNGPLHVPGRSADLDRWLAPLTSHRRLFPGEETTVSFGDRAAGPDHGLPTSGAARHPGGLSVHAFPKTMTWQRATAEGMTPAAKATPRISRLERMDGQAIPADIRPGHFFGATP